jgi:hypothetical protein
MGDIVNLRRERKRRERDADAIEAASNRVRFGRRKAERDLTKAELSLAEKRIEGHRLTPGAGETDSSEDA